MSDTNPYSSPSYEGALGHCTSNSHVEFEFTLEDWIHFSIVQNEDHHRSAVRRGRRVLFVCAGFFALIGIGVALNVGELWILTPPLFVFAAYFAFRAIRMPQMYHNQLRTLLERMLARRSNRSVIGINSLTLTETGIETTAPGGHSFSTWWAVVDIEVKDDFAYIYLASIHAVKVPARAFATREHFTAFIENANGLWLANRGNI